MLEKNSQSRSNLLLNLLLLIAVPIVLLIAVLSWRNTRDIQTDLLVQELNTINLDQTGLQELVSNMGQADYVLLGESSHGTAEYYYWRSEITKKLIIEQNFSFVAVEGDWADLYQVNQYVKLLSDDGRSGREILASFERWPTWMWANEEFLDLVEWLRNYNQNLPLAHRVGVYGKDVYGVFDSIKAVETYLTRVDPGKVDQVTTAYQCLLDYQDNINAYVMDHLNQQYSCETEVTQVVELLRTNQDNYLAREENKTAYFNAKQNALVVKHGELYYRQSALGGAAGWNSRVNYMKQTVNRLTEYYQHQQENQTAKGIVWAHNTHVGDARATEMAGAGMINIGQLLRQKVGEDKVFIVGFGTYEGTVAAGREWGAQMQLLNIPPAKAGSLESLLSQLKQDQFILLLDEELPDLISQPRGHRAKGVVYNPENEAGNYVTTVLPQRYNAFIFINQTQAITPI